MMVFDLALALGYIGLSVCYIPQWWQVWRSRRIEGLSRYFLALLTWSLVLVQVGMAARSAPALIQIGNALALANVAILDVGVARALKAERRWRQ